MSSPTSQPPRRAALVISGLAFAFGLAWLAGVLAIFRQLELVDGEWRYVLGDHWGYDIEAYVRAAARLLEGSSLYLREHVETPYLPGGKDLYYYAPPLGVAVVPLAGLADHESSAVWYLLKVAALLTACLLMPVKLPVRALTFLGVAVSFWAMRDLVLGNVGVLLLLPMVTAWRWLDQPLGSIALAATISVRPSAGALLIWQVLRRRWWAAAWTIGAGIGLVLLTLPFVGIDGYRDYARVLANAITPGVGSENRDLGATLVTLGLPGRWIDLVRLGSIALGGLLILLSLRRDRELGFMITLTASMLMVPLMWEFYLITLALPLALMAERWRPAVLLLLALSWLPSAYAPAVLIATLALLFLLPAGRRERQASIGQDTRGTVAPAA
jgi:hypothetical protein